MKSEPKNSFPTSIRTLIVDDDPIFRFGLQATLEDESEIAVVALLEDGQSAIDFLHTNSIDVILMDVDMPKMSGIETMKKIHSFKPDQPIVMITSFHNDIWLHESLSAGAVGFITKTIDPVELATAIKITSRGKHFVEGRALNLLTESYIALGNSRVKQDIKAQDLLSTLTPSETKVWELACKAYSNQQIANRLSIQPGTVKQYLNSIYKKLQVNSRTELILQAGQIKH